MSLNRGELSGLLVLDKPGGMTSRDAINRVQRTLPRRTKIGHTGTLDPLATGVLVVCIGQATRLAEYVQAMGKTYRSTFLLGVTSDTDDADGTITPRPDTRPAALTDIEAALSRFVGDIDQVPPAYSAMLTGGQRAYDLARSGGEVELKARRVTVYGIDVLRYEWPHLEIEVRCGKGTYIRSLARDLGEALGCGGLVAVLRRTRVGPFAVEQAVPLDADLTTITEKLRPMPEALSELPHVSLGSSEVARLRHGQSVAVIASPGEVALLQGETLIGVGISDGRMIRPAKVLS